VGIVALDHVQIAAPEGCEPQARAFYGGLLGLSELPKPAGLAARGGVWFAVGDQQLHVGVEHPFAPARKAHPALRAASSGALRALARDLEEHGVEVAWDADLPGSERCFVHDPWGNRLELLAGDMPA
jgi:catechol 2,3-dioxygenase-like lactoylglutathione lyase family enzyme